MEKSNAVGVKCSPVLPPELWAEIFVRLPLVEVLNCKLVCRRWHQVIKEVTRIGSQQWLVLDSESTNWSEDVACAVQDMDDDLRTVCKFELRFLGGGWSPPNCDGERWWAGIGRSLTELYLNSCNFSIDELATVFRCVTTRLRAFAIADCDVVDGVTTDATGADLLTIRERLSGLKLFDFRARDDVDGCIAVLRLLSQVLPMDTMERLRLNLCRLGTADEHGCAAIWSVLDAFRNVALVLSGQRCVESALRLENVTIRELDVSMGTFSDAVFAGLRRHAPCLRALHVSVAYETLSDNGEDKFVKLFPTFTELGRFSMPSFYGGGELLSKVSAHVLSDFKKLKWFGLGVRLEDDEMGIFSADRLTPARNLPESMQMSDISSVASQLSTLKLSCAPHAILNQLSGMKRITVLYLEITDNVDDRVIQVVFEHLIELRELSILRCELVTDVGLTGHPALIGAAATAAASTGWRGISRLRKLERLELDLPAMSDLSLQITLPRLKRFGLRPSPEVTAAAVIDLLRRHRSIDRLSLSRSFREIDVISIIETKPRLYFLRVSWMELTPLILEAIEKHIPNLRCFEFSFCSGRISAENIADLKSRRPYLIVK